MTYNNFLLKSNKGHNKTILTSKSINTDLLLLFNYLIKFYNKIVVFLLLLISNKNIELMIG